MAIVNITEDVFIIFTSEDKIHFVKNNLGETTSYNNEVWTAEVFPSKQEWINRLNQLGIDTSEL